MRHDTYPSAYSCFSAEGTQLSHHRQSEASFAKILPETVWMRVESYVKGVAVVSNYYVFVGNRDG